MGALSGVPQTLWRNQGQRFLGLWFQSEPLYCDLIKLCMESGFRCFRKKKKKQDRNLLTTDGIPSFVRGATCDPERKRDFSRVTKHERQR